jgi:ATP-dependent Clp protease protease subunit
MKFRLFFASIVLLFAIAPLSAFALTVIPEEDIEYKNDIVVLDEGVTKESVDKVVGKIHQLQTVRKDKPIYFLIDSYGGEIQEGMRVINSMEVSQRPIYTVAVGTSDSMGAIIHAHGVKRYMLPSAEIMYHLASANFSGDIVRTRSRLNHLELQIKIQNAYICSRANISPTELELMEMKEWWLGPDEALERKIIDDTIASTAFVLKEIEKDKDVSLDKKTDPMFPWLPFR